MIAVIFAALFLYLLYCRPYYRDLFKTGEYMSQQRTTMLNGFFILVVFVSHALGYLPQSAELCTADLYCKVIRD